MRYRILIWRTKRWNRRWNRLADRAEAAMRERDRAAHQQRALALIVAGLEAES